MGTGVWDGVCERLGDCMVVSWYHSHPTLGTSWVGVDVDGPDVAPEVISPAELIMFL